MYIKHNKFIIFIVTIADNQKKDPTCIQLMFEMIWGIYFLFLALILLEALSIFFSMLAIFVALTSFTLLIPIFLDESLSISDLSLTGNFMAEFFIGMGITILILSCISYCMEKSSDKDLNAKLDKDINLTKIDDVKKNINRKREEDFV